MTAGVAGLGVALASVIAVTTPAHAVVGTIEVTSVEDSGPGTLRSALAEAQATTADDQITFAPTVQGTIQLTSGQLVATVGGSSGSLVIVGPGSNVLAIDAGHQSRVLDVQGPGGDTRPTAVVSGLTLTGGYARIDGFGSPADGGGALRATGTDLTLDQIVVSKSATTGSGGGALVRGGTLLVTTSTFTGNTAVPSDQFSGFGGGLYVDDQGASGARVDVRDSAATDNTASIGGGGFASRGPAPMTVTGSTVSGNTAASVQILGYEAMEVFGDGGGISAQFLTVTDSRILGNHAGVNGGGVDALALAVTGSTISDNDAGKRGGGLRLSGAQPGDELRMTSSTLSGNRAENGGGVYLGSDIPIDLTLATVAGNSAVLGGGIFSPGAIALQGTVVAMNAGGDLGGGGSATLDHALVQEPRGFAYTDSGGSITGADPRLIALAYHGGPTPTLLPASNSPVIDHSSAFATTDQRGFVRPVDDADSPNVGDGSDIGSVELTPTELAALPQVGSTARPTITGRALVGTTLHTDGGAWDPADVTLGYRWLRDGVPIPGATKASYTLGWDDFGENFYVDDRIRISVEVTAQAGGFRPATALSDFTDFVAFEGFTMDGLPRVDGRTRVGSVLRARPRLDAVSPRPYGFVIQWFLDGRQVQSADGDRRFRLGPNTRGKRVKVRFVYTPPSLSSEEFFPLVRVVRKPHPVR